MSTAVMQLETGYQRDTTYQFWRTTYHLDLLFKVSIAVIKNRGLNLAPLTSHIKLR
jgi:hypothetical protein